MQGFFRSKVHVLFLRTQVHHRIFRFEKRYQVLALHGIIDFSVRCHCARWSDFCRVREKGVERFFGPYDAKILQVLRIVAVVLDAGCLSA